MNSSTRLLNTWKESKILERIAEINRRLEKEKDAPRSRRRRLGARLTELEEALAQKRPVGGNKRPKARNTKPDGTRLTLKARMRALKEKKSDSGTNSRWKECLCCRSKGHTMAECRLNPLNRKAKESGARQSKKAKPFCFNCGESDHCLRDCQKERAADGSLPFAACFICEKEGHIASACPDNATGLYPKGGGCHICNSPYHLMKDCPEKVERPSQKSKYMKKEEAQVKKQSETKKAKSEAQLDDDAYWE